MANPLLITPDVDISYSINAVSLGITGFNKGLIIGNSSVISTATRTVEYASTTAMINAGFSPTSPEVLAATKYFGQSPAPQSVVIGVQGSGETALTAFQQCRLTNLDWYLGYVTGAADSDHLAIAGYVQSLTSPFTSYIVETNDAAVLANSTGNLFLGMAADTYGRTQGIYSTSTYIGAGLLGFLCANLSLKPNSRIIEKFTKIIGATPENITEAQFGNVTGNNGNLYVTRGSVTGYRNGTMFDGQWADNLFYGDILVTNVQLAISNLYNTTNFIPQTEGGMGQLTAVMNQACQDLVNVGWLAPGQWNGSAVLALQPGQQLPLGYLVQHDSINAQSESDRTQRKSPNFYICAKTAGAVQSVFIAINVNQ